jgi:hypothetical protein
MDGDTNLVTGKPVSQTDCVHSQTHQTPFSVNTVHPGMREPSERPVSFDLSEGSLGLYTSFDPDLDTLITDNQIQCPPMVFCQFMIHLNLLVGSFAPLNAGRTDGTGFTSASAPVDMGRRLILIRCENEHI